MSTQPSQRGLTWFQALAGQGEAVAGLPASLRADHGRGDTGGDPLARW